MRLTLLRAKEALKPFAPADRLEYRLNRVCERYLVNGKFAGSLHRLRFRAPYGQLTLPRHYRTVEGVKVDGRVYEIANHWYEFLPGQGDTFGYSLEAVRDLGDGLATLSDIRLGGSGFTNATIALTGGGGTGATASVKLQNDWIDDIEVDNGGTGYTSAPTVVITGDGAGATAVATISGGKVVDVSLTPSGTLTVVGAQAVTIYGVDNQFLPVEVTIAGNATVANTFARIDRIHKEQGDISIVLHQTVNATRIDLAVMAPTEEETFYRRYSIDNLSRDPSPTVKVLAKLRHIEFTKDTDILPITNLSALENGLNALQFEAEHDTTAAGKYWDIGLDILNKELGDTNAENSLPALRIHYPKGTKPKFQGFY